MAKAICPQKASALDPSPAAPAQFTAGLSGQPPMTVLPAVLLSNGEDRPDGLRNDDLSPDERGSLQPGFIKAANVGDGTNVESDPADGRPTAMSLFGRY